MGFFDRTLRIWGRLRAPERCVIRVARSCSTEKGTPMPARRFRGHLPTLFDDKPDIPERCQMRW